MISLPVATTIANMIMTIAASLMRDAIRASPSICGVIGRTRHGRPGAARGVLPGQVIA